jgi:plasmid replication initiation protein
MNLVSNELTQRLLMKHTATVHSSSRLTMIQKKIFNLFIYKAFPTIQDDKYHTFQVSDLMKNLNWSVDSHMNERLKESLAGLTRENVKWNILEKDRKHKWVSSACLADVSIKNGIIEYSFGKFLREVLHNPNIYAKIDLDVQGNLESKDSLIIWELAMEELSSKKTSSSVTPWIEWGKICCITSGEESSYAKTYSLYKSKVLNKAIAEINAKTDLQVKMLEKKEGRRIKNIAFHVTRINNSLNENVSNTANNRTLDDRNHALKDKMEQIMGTPERAKELWLKYSDKTIKGAIDFYADALKNDVVKNPVAFFKKALEEGWYPLADALTALESKNPADSFRDESISFIRDNETNEFAAIRKALYLELGATLYLAWLDEASFCISETMCIIYHPKSYAHNYIMQKLVTPILNAIRSKVPKVKSIDMQYTQPELL